MREFHSLADHMTMLKNFTKDEIREFSAFPFSLHLMFDETLSNLIICLVISHKKLRKKLHKRASVLEHEFEMRLAKTSN